MQFPICFLICLGECNHEGVEGGREGEREREGEWEWEGE